MIIGKVKFTVEYISWKTQAVSTIATTIDFDETDKSIYFTYTFHDLSNEFICSVSQAIPKQIIGEADQLDFAINFAAYSINHYRMGRKNIFKVIEIAQVL